MLVLLLVVALPWSELEVTGRGAFGSPIKKVAFGIPNPVGVLCVGYHGGSTRKLLIGYGAPGKMEEAAWWSSYTLARIRCGDIWPRRRPLHTPMTFLRMCVFNLLKWRPSYFDAADQAHLRLSGLIWCWVESSCLQAVKKMVVVLQIFVGSIMQEFRTLL